MSEPERAQVEMVPPKPRSFLGDLMYRLGAYLLVHAFGFLFNNLKATLADVAMDGYGTGPGPRGRS